MWQTSGGGTAVRRMNLKREDGVAMTEFALIVPVFLLIVRAARLRAGVLLLDRGEPHGERDRALGRRRPQPVRPGRRCSSTRRRIPRREFASDVEVCIDFPSGVVDLGEPVRVRIQKPFTFLPILGVGRSRSAASSTMRVERLVEQRRPGQLPGTDRRQHRDVHMSPAAARARRHARMAAVMIPVFLLLTALVVDVGNWYTHKRQLQDRADAGAFAAGVEYAKNWKACVQSGDAALARDGGRSPTRRGSTPATPRRPTTAAAACRRRSGTPRSRTRRTSTSSSTRTTRTTTTTPTTPTAAARRRSATRATSTRPATTSPRAGHWTDVASRSATSRPSSARSGSRSHATAPGRGSRSARRSAATGSCRSPCRTT